MTFVLLLIAITSLCVTIYSVTKMVKCLNLLIKIHQKEREETLTIINNYLDSFYKDINYDIEAFYRDIKADNSRIYTEFCHMKEFLKEKEESAGAPSKSFKRKSRHPEEESALPPKSEPKTSDTQI